MQGICDRDRPVTAGRSHFLSTFPSLYRFVQACRDIVRRFQERFDFHAHLSNIALDVFYVLMRAGYTQMVGQQPYVKLELLTTVWFCFAGS